MSEKRPLGEREATVLRLVVSDYIRTGEPVGSAAVAKRHRLPVSAATIRNDMAALEDRGYLNHPHTSAGRIPTDLGYRYYVDAIPRWPRLHDTKRRAIEDFFDEAVEDADEVVRGTAVLLSRLTHHGAVAQPPGSPHVILGGAANIASEEAFERRETVSRLLELLEEERAMLELLDQLAGMGEVVVRIGRENPFAAMREASVIVAPYRLGPDRVGAIAVIGPTRMEYPAAMSTIRAVSHGLSRTIQALAG
ncbi:MAG: HrcA family transcriptional regulator [Actinomycetota bacterium]